MTAPARRPRRRSGNGTESPTLARLAAARERLDAEIVERRRREDGLLTEYAAATDAVTEAWRAGTRRSPNWSAGPLRYARRPSRNWPRSRRARARSWRRCTGTAPPRNWPTSSRCRCAGCGLFCDRTGNPRGPPKPVPRPRRRRPQRRHRPLNWGRRPGIRGRAATGPPGRRRLQDPTQNRTRGHRPGIVRRGTRGGAHRRGTRCGAHRRGTGPPRPSRADRGRLASGSAGAPQGVTGG